MAVYSKHNCLLSAVLHGKLYITNDNQALYLPTKVTQEVTLQKANSLQDILKK